MTNLVKHITAYCRRLLLTGLVIVLCSLLWEQAKGGGPGCTPAANDACVDAFTLPINGHPCVTYTTCGTVDGNNGSCYTGTRDQDVWFKFVATAPEMQLLITWDGSGAMGAGCGTSSVAWSGACVPTSEISCRFINTGKTVTTHVMTGLIPGNTYLIDETYWSGMVCGKEQNRCLKIVDHISSGSDQCCANNGTNVYNDWCSVFMNKCYSFSLNGATWTISGGCKGANPTMSYRFTPRTTSLNVTVSNLGAGFGGNVELVIQEYDNDYNSSGSQTEVIACGPAPFNQALTVVANREYNLFISSSTGSNGATSTFDLCIRDGGSCSACGPDPGCAGGPPGDAYCVFSPDALGGTVDDCQMIGTAGTGGIFRRVSANGVEVGTSEAVSGFPVIVEENITCTGTNVDFTTTDASPHSWNFGAGATPGTSITNPQNDVVYSTTGRKNIVYDGNTYLGFQNIVMAPPPTGTVLGPNNTCPGIYSYSSSEAGTPGFTYLWSVTNPDSGTATIATDTASTTNITYTNSSVVTPIIFPLVLTITSGCCGTLAPITFNVTISYNPAAPGVAPASVSKCIGGAQTLNISPVTAGFNYVWYNAPTAGALLGSGTTYTVSPVLTGATSYYAEAANALGCISATRTEVAVTGTDTPPSVTSVTSCLVGIQNVCVNAPISGATYSWYTASTSAVPVQTGSNSCYNLNNPGPPPNTVSIWVSVTETGCGETTRSQIDFTVPTTPTCPKIYRSITTGDWAVAATWESSVDGGVTWTNPAITPPAVADGIILVRDGHNVTVTTAVTFDEVTVQLGGILTYGSAGDIIVNNGTGVDLLIEGTFNDNSSNNMWDPAGAQRWKFGNKGVLIRTTGTSCNSWQDHYDGGIGTIPATSYWINRKTSSTNPPLSSTNGSGAYYGNLTIESNFGAWTTASGSIFEGFASTPTVKGNLDIGGTGSGTVSFLNENTNAATTLVQGSVIIRSGDTLRNYGTGFEIQGDSLSIEGTLAYDAADGRQIVFSGSKAQSIIGAGTINIFTLIVNKSSNNLTLNRAITVDNTLTLTSGPLLLNGYTLTIANGITTAITRASGYVVSETNAATNPSILQWNIAGTGAGLHIFPFGVLPYDPVDGYIPVTFNNSGASGNILISTRHTTLNDNQPWTTGVTAMSGPGTNITSAADRWWEITSSDVLPLPPVALTLTYLGVENATTTSPTDERGVQHWSGAYWDNGQGGLDGTVTLTGTAGVTTSVSSVTAAGIMYFSPFVIVRGAAPLPINLLNFNAIYNVNTEDVDLTWATSSEINNEYFTVDKSRDGKDFGLVVKVPGAGNSNKTLYYTQVDKNPWLGLSYYRLKQTDYDGKFEYSYLVAVNILKTLNFSIRPNPATNYLEVVFGKVSKNTVFVMTPEYHAEIKIYDTDGRVVYSKKFDGTFYKFNINIASFNPGIYVVTLTANGENYSARFVKE